MVASLAQNRRTSNVGNPGLARPNESARSTANAGRIVAWLLGAAVISSIFEIYIISIAGTYPASAMLLAQILLVAVVVTQRFRLSLPICLCISVLLYQMVSLAWSPDLMLGARHVVYDELPFFSIYFAAEATARSNERWLIRIMKIYALAAVIQSLLTILFRLVPSTEEAFLNSGVARIFINPNALDEAFELMIVNVFSDDKAGGLTIYCNLVGLWGFAAAGIAVIVSRHGKKPFWYGVAGIHLLSSVACGSKAALVLLFLVPAMLVGLYYKAVFRKLTAGQVLFVLAALVAVVVAVFYILLNPSDFSFLQNMVVTVTARETMWSFAADAFAKNPIPGLGFGGWSQDFSAWLSDQGYVGTDRFYPPHNGFVYMWSESGLIVVILAVAATCALLLMAYRARLAPGGRLISIFAFGSYFWLIAQSMGENWNIFGEPHTQAPIALLLGYASAYARVRKAKPS